MASKKQSRRNASIAKGDAQARMLSALHEVWLAGLGAVVKAQRGAPKLLEDLIAEGARFQEDKQGLAEETFRRLIGDAQARFKAGVGQVRGQANEAFENLEKIFQTRVQRALSQLGVPSAHSLTALGKRVDALSQSVENLARSASRVRTRAGAKTPSRRLSRAPSRRLSRATSEPTAAP